MTQNIFWFLKKFDKLSISINLLSSLVFVAWEIEERKGRCMSDLMNVGSGTVSVPVFLKTWGGMNQTSLTRALEEMGPTQRAVAFHALIKGGEDIPVFSALPPGLIVGTIAMDLVVITPLLIIERCQSSSAQVSVWGEGQDRVSAERVYTYLLGCIDHPMVEEILSNNADEIAALLAFILRCQAEGVVDLEGEDFERLGVGFGREFFDMALEQANEMTLEEAQDAVIDILTGYSREVLAAAVQEKEVLRAIVQERAAAAGSQQHSGTRLALLKDLIS